MSAHCCNRMAQEFNPNATNTRVGMLARMPCHGTLPRVHRARMYRKDAREDSSKNFYHGGTVLNREEQSGP
jgi:hypothetical protein